MKKIFKKTLSLMLCVAFSGMQMSLATVLTNGDFAGRDVLTGAKINGHTAGLSAVETNAALNKATLKFTDNTRIDWSKLNVKNAEELHFKNGSFGVLNNVLNGMSTFAGKVTSESGKIIISNPNGMLFNGGTFNGGALLLTTKDMTSLGATDAAATALNFAAIDPSALPDGASFGAIAIIGGSKISSPDFTIVANGVKMDGSSEITAGNAGVILVTADGANFTANKVVNFDGTNVGFYDEPLDIANTAFAAEDGTITLSTTKDAYIVNSNFEGDVTVKSNKLHLGDSSDGQLTTVKGDLNLETGHNTFIVQTNVDGDTTVSSTNGLIDLYKVTLGKEGESHTTSLTTPNRYIRFEGDVKVNGDMNLSSNSLNMGYYMASTGGALDPSTVYVTGDLYADIYSTIGFSDTITAKNITLISHESSILGTHVDDYHSSLNTIDGNGTITLSAEKGEVTSLNGKVPEGGKSDYFSLMSYQGHVTVDKLSEYNDNKAEVRINGGSADVTTKGVASVWVDLDKDLTVNAGGNALISGDVDGNATVVGGRVVDIDATNVGGNLDVDSVGNVFITNTEVGGNTDVDASNGIIDLYKVTLGKEGESHIVNLTTPDRYIRFEGDVKVNGDMNLSSNSLNMGYYMASNGGVLDPSTVYVTGDLYGDIYSTIGFSDTVTAKNITLISHESSILSTYVDDYKSSLNTIDGNGTITLQADKGEIVSLNGKVPAGAGSKSDYFSKMSYQGHLTADRLADVADSKANVNLAGGNATLTSKGVTLVDSNLAGNLNITSSDANAKVTGVAGGNVVVNTKTNIDANDLTAGDVALTSSNGDILLNKVTSAGNVKGSAVNGKITVADNLTADNDSNGAGDVDLNAKQLVGDNFTKNNSTVAIKGANVKLAQTDSVDDMKMSNITAVGLDDNNGNVTVVLPGAKNVDVANIEATHDITLLNDANLANRYDVQFDTVKLNKIHADSESNGRGDLNIRSKGDITANDISGANIYLTSKDGTVSVTDATSARSAADTTASAQVSRGMAIDTKSGNIVVTSENGNIELNNLTAGSDIIGSAVNGTVSVLGNLTADAEDMIGVAGVASNTYGDVILSGKQLLGDNFSSLDSAVAIQGASVRLTQSTVPANDTMTLSNITALAVGNDQAGDIVIAIPAENVDLKNIHATHDINVLKNANDNPGAVAFTTVKLEDVVADSEANGRGELNLKATGDITAKNIGGANITLTSTASDVIVDGAVSHRGANDTTGKEYGNVKLTAQQGNVTLGKIDADTDIIGSAVNGNINQTGYLTADKEGNNIGDVILTAKDGLTIGDAGKVKGANIELSVGTGDINASNLEAVAVNDDNNGNITVTTPSGNVNITGNTNATHDIVLTARKGGNDAKGKVTVSGANADSELNGRGDLIINADNDIVATTVTGANITATTPKDITIIGATATRAAADTDNKLSGNVVATTTDGNMTLSNIVADTDIIGSATNGTITVAGNLTADNEGNTIGDVILSGKQLVGENFSSTASQIAIKGANVELTQSIPQDNLILSNITAAAAGNDNAGDVTINVPVKTVDLNNINATKDIVVDNGTADGVLDSAKLTGVYADSEGNGVGDLKIKTKGDIIADGISGANIELTSQNGNITVNDADSKRGNQADADAGNITLTAQNGNISAGDINADTDIMVDAINGAITQTGDLIADATDHNGIGTVTLKAKDGLDVGGDKGVIKGGDIVLEVTTGDIIASNLDANGQGDDNHGNISIYTPNGDVTIGTETQPVKGTGDVTIITDNGKATVKNTEADSEQNGIGTLTIKATDDVDASNVGGGNVDIESTDGNVTATDVTAHAPNDNNNGDVTITANNGDVTVDGVNGDHDVIITAGGDAKVTDAHADTDNNKAGDLIINAGGKADVEDGSGNNVQIIADDDITAKDIKGNDDVTIISNNGSVDADNVIADAPNPNTVDSDGIGDLYIQGKDDVDVQGGSGADVTIISDEGDVTADDIHATGDDDQGNKDTGNIEIIAENGDVTITDSDANGDIEITVTDGNVIAVIPDLVPDNNNDGHGDLIINRNPNPGPNPNPVIGGDASQEVIKNLNNLLQSGVDTQLAQAFTPIGFAADDEDEDSAVLKKIVKTVFKTPETGIVTITDRFKSVK